MIHIGLTGGIASGKSFVGRLFEAEGVTVLDADEAARCAVEPGSPGLEAVVAQFGTTVLHSDGTLNRKALRQQIFDSPQKRLQLEQILHPRIAEIMLQWAAQVDAPYLIFMIPLLNSRAGRYPIDRILVIDVPESVQIERLMERDQITEAEAEATLAAQISREARLQLADDLILNLNKETLPAAVRQLHQQYLQLANRR